VILLSAEQVTLSFNERVLFDNITLSLNKGDKLALVGANGAGKSSLMKILNSQLEPVSGNVVKRKGVTVGYLPQEPQLDVNKSLIQNLLLDSNPKARAITAYYDAMDNHGENMEHALKEMESEDAWNYESEVHKILHSLGLEDLHQPAGNLSGGQKKRAALASLLLSQSDVLLLDEPTNHLFLEAIEWLEEYLSPSSFTFLLISHDRYFLDQVCTGIIELEDKKLYRHAGKYQDYLLNKSTREEISKQTAGKAANLYKKELEWLRRQPKARGTKSRARIDAAAVLKETANSFEEKKEAVFEGGSTRLGSKIMEIHELGVGYEGKSLITDFSYVFKRGDRLGIIGKNGSGKTSLLKTLTGKIAPVSGSIDIGETLNIAYYTQDTDNLNPEARLVEDLKTVAEVFTSAGGKSLSITAFLEQFGFRPDQHYTPIHKLSGGERRKAQLVKVLLQKPNFLILDEPTNDLDHETLGALEDYLQGFPGCLVIVSHDRFFLDNLVEHLWILNDGGTISDYPGNYSDFRYDNENKESSSAVSSIQKENVVQKPKQKSAKLSFKDQEEFQRLETEIANLENICSDIISRMNSGETDHNALLDLGKTLENNQLILEEKTLRWLELSEKSGA
jgi:ATP-binding cassette subfamily F protein uup